MPTAKALFFLSMLASLTLIGAEIAQAQATSAQNDPEALVDTQVVFGSNNIAEAWLIEPTQRYAHYVRGSDHEAGGLRLRTTQGKILTFVLGGDLVFEDRIPRLADLDGDGRDEIILVLTSVTEGASLAAYTLAGDHIALKARTPFIGRPYRWLNPAGIADYDGDGQTDVALVQMPHLAKRLEIWTLGDRGFRRSLSVEDVSNHRNGSSHTELSASADFNGDGVVDLAILDGDYRTVRVLSFAQLGGRDINRFSLPARASGNFKLTREDENWHLSIPLEDGTSAELSL